MSQVGKSTYIINTSTSGVNQAIHA